MLLMEEDEQQDRTWSHGHGNHHLAPAWSGEMVGLRVDSCLRGGQRRLEDSGWCRARRLGNRGFQRRVVDVIQAHHSKGWKEGNRQWLQGSECLF